MKLCVDNDWLRQQIANDPLSEVGAGRDIRSSADVVKAIESATETPDAPEDDAKHSATARAGDQRP